MTSRPRLGILVGGGPAPGINSALGAAVIEAAKKGVEAVGIYDGFEHLIKGRTDMSCSLTAENVADIHFQGGSILRTARANPANNEGGVQRTIDTLKQLGIGILITIGGEDTATAAARICQDSRGGIRVAHIPKTIDNDLPLPANTPTFGFETARHLGTQSVLNLIEEARTTNRWCLVVVMGRTAGHLALGIGKAAGATITVIPEEFSADKISLDDLCLVLEGAILKRRLEGRTDGLAVIAEGVAAKMDPVQLAGIPGVEVTYDAYGHVSLGKIPLASIIEREIVRRFADRDESLPLVPFTLGYELRCAAPIPFDIDYTRTLGYGAVRFLLGDVYRDGPAGGVICLDSGRLRVLPFDEIHDPNTGKVQTRLVDITSEHYLVAREYMVRLTRGDLEDHATVAGLAASAGMTADDFSRSFRRVIDADAGENRRG